MKVSSVAFPLVFIDLTTGAGSDFGAEVIGFKIEILIGNVRSKFSRTHDSPIHVTDTETETETETHR